MADTEITQLVPSLLVQSEAYYDITVPQPSSLRTQGQQQECQQQHPQQAQCQDQEVHHPAQQVNQNINVTSVNIAGSKFLFFLHSLFRRLQ